MLRALKEFHTTLLFVRIQSLDPDQVRGDHAGGVPVSADRTKIPVIIIYKPRSGSLADDERLQSGEFSHFLCFVGAFPRKIRVFSSEMTVR
jgi:hypothetical protein